MKRSFAPRCTIGSLLRPCVALAALWACAAVAGSAVLTDESAFLDAVAQYGVPIHLHTQDFEQAAPGTTIPDGTAFGAVTWHYTIAGGSVGLAVGSELPTTSGKQFLGLGSAEVQDRQIQHGDAFDLGLPPSRAFAMKIVAGDPLRANDVQLLTEQGTAGNSAVAAGTTSDGGHIYFIGLISAQSFDLVQVRYGDADGAVAFLYTVDDVMVGEPVPNEIFADGFEASEL